MRGLRRTNLNFHAADMNTLSTSQKYDRKALELSEETMQARDPNPPLTFVYSLRSK